MNESYIGRICPYCKIPITDTDEIVVCPDCGTAMHVACREAAGRCVALGCGASAVTAAGAVEAAPSAAGEAAAPGTPESPPDIPETALKADAPQPEVPRTPEEIYRRPSFCPACGSPVAPGEEACGSCGFVFAAHPAAKPKKKKLSKGLLALIIVLVAAIAAGGAGFGIWHAWQEETRELHEEMYEHRWLCQELSDQVFAEQLFVSDYYISFDGQNMNLTTQDILFGTRLFYSAAYTVDSPRQVTLQVAGEQPVVYTVVYEEDGPYDRMTWTSETGTILHFTEIDSTANTYYYGG